MAQTLTSIYTSSVPEGLMSWQDVYKVYVLSLLTTLESRTRMEFNDRNPEKFQKFVSQLELTYDSSQMYIRLLAPSDALDIMKQYLTVMVPLHDCYESIPDNSTWQDWLITLLNFWVRLTEDMQDIASNESSVKKLGFYPGSLLSCLKVFMRLVMEDIVSPSQSWDTIAGYVANGLIDDFAVEILIFCKAMVFSGCDSGAISEVFSEAISQHDTSSTSSSNCESQDILHLYTNILEPILKDLESGSHENQNLYHLLSSLSKLEGQLENLQRVREVVWERMAQFSDNSQLPSQVRVYVLELMQLIRGRNIKGFSAELQSKVLPWEGWDEFLSTRSETTANLGLLDNTDASTQFTSTLVALKSSQLVAAISPSLEISPDDLLNVKTAVSCFLKLCEVSNSNADIDVLLTVLEEWEGFFVEKTHRAETSEAGNTDWNSEDWDEGWESFQEVETFEKDKTESSFSIHPLHVCWMEIFKKLITVSRFNDLLTLVDQSLSKSNGILLDEDGAWKLSQVIVEMDCFVALKFGLLLPYNSIQLQCLDVVEERLKRGGISDTVGWDNEFFILVISSKIISTIITKTVYGTTFSYLCYLAGNFCRRCLEAQLSSITEKRKKERVDTQKEVLLLFRRILFPSFISELVMADQQILAGFLVTKYMHTNASLSLVNVAEASLRRYLERQHYSLQHDKLTLEEMSSCKMLKNTVSFLKGELGNLIQSALALLPASLR
ncbi:hypothetical protein JCGZ_09833 [Jatropha curcas]|uniref:Uncharacterized protein n=2 Tax=Jatropha curcas TaxID=180498 RepID=A0A067KMS1_JATCU|nr:hypothetical protein JCGZ_09833 [Jatropha curcas]